MTRYRLRHSDLTVDAEIIGNVAIVRVAGYTDARLSLEVFRLFYEPTK